MDAFQIRGGTPLEGEIKIGGMKNAALPMVAASLLAKSGTSVIRNVQDLRDIRVMLKILDQLGALTEYDADADEIRVNAENLISTTAPYELVKQLRASFYVTGALLGRKGHCRVSMPGGCAIGNRPVTDQLLGFRRLGGVVVEEQGYVDITAEKLEGAVTALDFPAVSGTINLLLAAVLADGVTVIGNAARDPELVDTCLFLVEMGAKIDGVGTGTLIIEGVDSLSAVTYEVAPDRINAATFAVAAAMTKGQVRLVGARVDHFRIVISKLQDAGATVVEEEGSVTITGPERLDAVNIRTLPYPAFPTDVQAPMMAAMTLAQGACVVWEQVYDNRFTQGPELRRMGANITIAGDKAVVVGVPMLKGAQVMASDIRAGAALVLAGLAAQGDTTVSRVYHIDRGYNRLERDLASLGAVIERVVE